MSVLATEDLTVRYGARRALDGVTLEVEPGSVFALLGANGAGKSSLVRCVLGEQKPAAGRARLFGRDVWRERAAQARASGQRLIGVRIVALCRRDQRAGLLERGAVPPQRVAGAPPILRCHDLYPLELEK